MNANTSLGFCADIAMPMRPMRSVGRPFLRAGSVRRFHVLPPSGPVGWMTMRPMARVSPRPIFVQLLPPSVDLYTPSPQYWERRLFFSPVPTQRMLLSEGATARSPTVSLPRPLETDCQVMPPLVVFQTPPPAAPMYHVLG